MNSEEIEVFCKKWMLKNTMQKLPRWEHDGDYECFLQRFPMRYADEHSVIKTFYCAGYGYGKTEEEAFDNAFKKWKKNADEKMAELEKS
jgi:hypothetical protein